VEQRPALLVGAGVVGAQQREEVALGLVCHHLEEVDQVLALRGELNDGPVADISHLDPARSSAPLVLDLPDRFATVQVPAGHDAIH
jgi:hypothetical protein